MLATDLWLLISLVWCYHDDDCSIHDTLMLNLFSLRSAGEGPRLAWQLLSLVAEENNLDLQRHLRRAMGRWSRTGKLTRPLVSAICSHVESEDNLKVYMIVDVLASMFVGKNIFPEGYC